jgi:hypothetical protein
MKSTIFTIICTFCTLLLFAQSPSEVMKISIDKIAIGDMEMTSTIRIEDGKGNVRIRQINTISVKFGECTKRMIRFLAPAEVKGTALLIYDFDNQSDNIWIYMPALRKVRRILSSEKGKNFMGSEFTNADMTQPNADDYIYTDTGSKTIDGKICRMIEAKCKNNEIMQENNFSKKISYIDKSENLCYRVDFYDLNGQLYKIQYISNYQKQNNGKFFALKMVMENVKNGRKSILITDKIQTGSTFRENFFSPGNLEKQ